MFMFWLAMSVTVLCKEQVDRKTGRGPTTSKIRDRTQVTTVKNQLQKNDGDEVGIQKVWRVNVWSGARNRGLNMEGQRVVSFFGDGTCLGLDVDMSNQEKET